MKIKHLFGPKSGSFDHLQPHVATTLISAGLAEAVPLPPYGSREWLAARNEQAASVNPPQPPAVVTWSIGEGLYTKRIRIDAKCSRANCGVFHFEGSEHDAAFVRFIHSCGADAHPEPIPANVRKEFARKKDTEVITITPDEGAAMRQASTGLKSEVGQIYQGKDAQGNAVFVNPWYKIGQSQ
jgi:hypothetical protein